MVQACQPLSRQSVCSLSGRPTDYFVCSMYCSTSFFLHPCFFEATVLSSPLFSSCLLLFLLLLLLLLFLLLFFLPYHLPRRLRLVTTAAVAAAAIRQKKIQSLHFIPFPIGHTGLARYFDSRLPLHISRSLVLFGAIRRLLLAVCLTRCCSCCTGYCELLLYIIYLVCQNSSATQLGHDLILATASHPKSFSSSFI